jgi:hypothetical protein
MSNCLFKINVKLLILTRRALVYHEIVKKTYMILIRLFLYRVDFKFYGDFVLFFFKVMNEFIKLTMIFLDVLSKKK